MIGLEDYRMLAREAELLKLQREYLRNSVDSALMQMKMEDTDYSNFDSILNWVKQNKKDINIHPARFAAMIMQMAK